MQKVGATRAQSITIAELQDNLLHYLQEVEAGATITIIGDDGAIAASFFTIDNTTLLT